MDESTNQVSNDEPQPTRADRVEIARSLENRRIERAEALATVAATNAATLRQHEIRLNAVNGHIRDLARETAATNLEVVGIKGTLLDLVKGIETIDKRLDGKTKDEQADRRSIKLLIYTLIGTILTSGVGAFIYSLLAVPGLHK